MHFVALSGISSPQYGHFLYPSMVFSIDDGGKGTNFPKIPPKPAKKSAQDARNAKEYA
jgi:hypothetical protein